MALPGGHLGYPRTQENAQSPSLVTTKLYWVSFSLQQTGSHRSSVLAQPHSPSSLLQWHQYISVPVRMTEVMKAPSTPSTTGRTHPSSSRL